MKKIVFIASLIIAVIIAIVATYNITVMNVVSNLEIDYTSDNKNIAVTYDGETEIYNIPFQN